MEWAKRFSIENILLDAALASTALWLPHGNLFWSERLSAALWLAAPLQVVALFCAFYGGGRFGGVRTLPS